MIPLDRSLPGPSELNAYNRVNPNAGPYEFSHDLTFVRVKPIIKEQRNRDQGGLCIYCERAIAATAGHIEHIYPKSLAPARSFAYENMAQSCEGNAGSASYKHCGHKKDNAVLTVEPGQGCNDFFLVLTDGTLVANSQAPGVTSQLAKALTDQVASLGLNEPALKRERAAWIMSLVAVQKADSTALPSFLADKPYRHILSGLFPVKT